MNNFYKILINILNIEKLIKINKITFLNNIIEYI